MKLIRYGNPGKEQPGIIIDDKMYGLPGFEGDYDANFFGGEEGMIKLQAYLATHQDNLEGRKICRAGLALPLAIRNTGRASPALRFQVLNQDRRDDLQRMKIAPPPRADVIM